MLFRSHLLVVMPIPLEALAKADKKKAEEEAAAKTKVTPEDIALMREIRDLLKEASAKKS